MAIKSSKKDFGNNRSVNYVNKDFGAFRQNLIDFTKVYFPDSYSDFNEASPGMVFIEMASYIGDVLSFYQDAQLKESMLQHATERKNIVALAQTMGYKPKITTPAVTTLTVYQLVPATGVGVNNQPDSTYYLKIKEGMEVEATTNSAILLLVVTIRHFPASLHTTYCIIPSNSRTISIKHKYSFEYLCYGSKAPWYGVFNHFAYVSACSLILVSSYLPQNFKSRRYLYFRTI